MAIEAAEGKTGEVWVELRKEWRHNATRLKLLSFLLLVRYCIAPFTIALRLTN